MMIDIFHSRAKNTALTLAAAIGLTLASVGCSEDNGLEAAEPSASSAQAHDLPDHDPEATSGGRTAEEIAEDLRGTSAYRQNKALEELMGMGVDALPAREAVRYVAEQAGGPDMSDTLADKHRLQALSTLYAMQAPEAVDLLREKILDPEYLTRDASYVKLLEAADQVGVDHETQVSDILSIIDTEPEHARRLMSLNALDAPVQTELQAALLEAGTMASAASAQEAEPSGRETAAQYLAEAQAKESEQDIRLTLSLFETWVGEQTAKADSPEDEAAYRRLFIDANAALIEQGPTDTHVQVGIQRQILYLQRQDDLPLEPAVGPIFDLLETGGASPAALNRAAQSLQLRPTVIAEHDQDYFIERTLGLLWQADTPELAKLPVAVLTALMRERGYAEPVLEQIADQIGPHQDDWAVNPATAVATVAGTLPWLDHRPERETAGAIMGQAFVSPAFDMDYLRPHLARGGGVLATLDRNTVDGVIAVFTPTVFAEEKPASYTIGLDSFMAPMLGRPAWLQRDADALETWIAFLERVAALDDPDFSPVAEHALAELE